MDKSADVYSVLRRRVELAGVGHAEEVLDAMVGSAGYYARFLDPSLEERGLVRAALERLGRLQATVVYAFLLSLFGSERRRDVEEQQVLEILGFIECFLVRRYVCGAIRAELNKIFPGLFGRASRFSTLAQGVREILSARNYPSDTEFLDSLVSVRLYGHGERRVRAKLILECLERQLEPREAVDMSALTIEHIMPQTLTPRWRDYLGVDADDTHAILLHTIGNLTLTGYNGELSNHDFEKKVEILSASNLRLNRDLAGLEAWGREGILTRADRLAEAALGIWPNFSPAEDHFRVEVTGRSPRVVVLLGDKTQVSTWQEVLQVTISCIASLGEDVIREVAREFPRYVGSTAAGMRNAKQIGDAVYYESHLSADKIHKLCRQVAQSVGFTSSDWRVELDD